MDAQAAMDVEMGVASPAHHAMQRPEDDLVSHLMDEFKKKRGEHRYLSVTKRRDVIFRVPANLREYDREAYEPRVVAIGPYHRENPRLQPMEAVKWKAVYRLASAQPNDAVKRCFEKLMAEEERARRCYPEPLAMGADDFIQMMLLDGCFIVLTLLVEEAKESAKKVGVAPEELINQLLQVQYDLLLLENQVPFFIIELIFEILAPTANLGRLICTLFSKLQPHKNVYAPVLYGKVHLLQLFHRSLVPPEISAIRSPSRPPLLALLHHSFSTLTPPAPPPPPPRPDMPLPPAPAIVPEVQSDAHAASTPPELTWFLNASELEKEGIVIKKKEGGDMLDVAFDDRHGVLHIPPLSINDHSKTIFRNLIALEQLHPGVKTHITAYAAFLGCLIRTERDVTILQRKDIIVNCLSTAQETVAFFNTLWRENWQTEPTSELQSQFVKLKSYSELRWPTWKAGLCRDYFGTPWAIISVIAAGALLLLTLIQTIFTVYPYFRPSRPN